MVEVDVEVVDVLLDYNLLLGCNWTYVVTVVVLFVFRTLFFPLYWKIMMINQLSFLYASPNTYVGSSIRLKNLSRQLRISMS
jgi:hypothetical protein